MRLMIDLFSGLGGASEAMYQSDEWSVLRYDNNPNLGYVPATTICDLKEFQIKCRHEIELIWASPPCQDFSNAYDAPRPAARRAGEDFEADLSLVKRAIEIIDELKPRYWIIENVIGAIKHFEPFLGPPRQIIGSFVLWGNMPFLHVDNFNHTKTGVDPGGSNPLRSNVRAKIPLELSQALRRAVESQTQLSDW